MIVRKKVNVTKIQGINNFGQSYHFTQLMKNDAHPMLNIFFPLCRGSDKNILSYIYPSLVSSKNIAFFLRKVIWINLKT